MNFAKVILILCFLGLTRCAPKRGTNAHSVQHKTHVMSDDGSHGSQKENVNNTDDKNPELQLNSHNLSKNFPVESLKETSTNQSETTEFLPVASQFQPESSNIIPETSQFQPLTLESAYYTTEDPSSIPQTTPAPWQAPVQIPVPESPPMEVPDTSEDLDFSTIKICYTSSAKGYPTACSYCPDCSTHVNCLYADCLSQQCADFVVSPGSCCPYCPNGTV
ncbi:hypothetical protein Btru_001879 [Bulinus truncatus]|nr:hypothetical protein Btru_001879 [Bulinus truncatus]